MTQTLFLANCRAILVAAIAYAAGRGWLTPADSGALTAILVPIGALVGPWVWIIYSNMNSKLVPHDSVAIQHLDGSKPDLAVGELTNAVTKVVGALLFGALILGGATRSYAADNLPVKLPSLVSATPCTPQSCSGWYAGFGILGDGSNADIIGNGINGSVFSTGAALKVQGGYQLWNGAWFAAIDASVGYEFTTNASAGAVNPSGGNKFVGTELVKLGYNFFPSVASATTAPSQSPLPLTVPANLLASSTPYLTFGGLQRRGISEWVNGVGIETVIAAGWSSDVRYLYAPSQQGVAATSIVMFEVNKHF